MLSNIRFCPIASGSNGNCMYFSSGRTSVLIDSGLSGVRIEGRLNSIKASGFDIDAIFVTHEHSDHAMGVGVLSRRYDIPVFATSGTWKAMERDQALGRISAKNKRLVYTDENLILNDIRIHPFSVPHDAAEPVGYTIEARGVKVAIATDMGEITREIIENISDADILLLESNHDEDMVRTGRYPEMLKRRILGNFGHLSNINCGRLLAQVITDRLRHAYLGHLSEENNRPELAYETVKNILLDNDFKVNEAFSLRLTDRKGCGAQVAI